MRLVIARHGQATNNLPGHHRDRTPRVGEHALTDLGVEQANRLGAFLAGRARPDPEPARDAGEGAGALPGGLRVTRIVSSPMARAVHTADILRSWLAVPCEVVVDLHEWGGPSERDPRDHGRVHRGLTREVLAAHYPRILAPDQVTSSGWWTGETRETPDACWARGARVLRALGRASRDGYTLVVTHHWFANVLRRLVLGQGNETAWWETDFAALHHTGWCVVDGETMTWDCCAHLNGEACLTS